MRMLDHICKHVGLDWTLGNFIFFVRTKTLIFDCLGGLCTVQPLGNFEAWLGNFLKNMGGKILGYNNENERCPLEVVDLISPIMSMHHLANGHGAVMTFKGIGGT